MTLFFQNLFLKIKNINYTFLICILLFFIFGIFSSTNLSWSDGLFIRQLIFAFFSTLVFIFVSFLDYKFLKNSYFIIFLYIFFIFILILIFIIGHTAKGGNRWLNFGSFLFSPSEPMKLILIIILAKFFSKRHIAIASLQNIIISFFYMIIPVILVAIQPDFSTAFVLFMIWFSLLLISGLPTKYFFIFILIASSLLFFLWNFYFLDYQKNRIITFINPGYDLRGTGWNAYQSVISVGSGGFLGKGIGYGTQSRLGFLPEHETDFIFASFTEEWGTIGAIFVFIILGIIIFNLIHKAKKANGNFETFFILGVSIWIIIQSTMNIGMNLGLLPVTGIPLPFFSHGGTHILTESIALGLCVSMSRKSRIAHKEKYQNEFVGLG